MNILAIQEGHTSTAALSINDKIVGCVSEERFLRKKNYEGYPKNAINYLIKKFKVKIDKVILCGQLSPGLALIGREHNFKLEHHIRQQKENFYPVFYQKKNPYKTQKVFFEKMIKEFNYHKKKTQFIFPKKYKFTCNPKIDIPSFNKVRINTVAKHLSISKKKVELMDHHRGHIYYAYFSSPYRMKNCLIITADGDGDYGINATVSIAKKDQIKEIFRTDNQPIAKLWRYFTLMLGMKPQQHEYKVMGLAPYANPYITKKVFEILNDHFELNGLKFVTKKKPKDLYFYFKDLLEGLRFDGLAGGLQLWTESLTKKWFLNILKKYKISRVVFSGGLAMNIKVNKILSEIKFIKEFYVPASGGDESLPIGGCYYAMSKKFNPQFLKNIYLGPDYSNSYIVENLKNFSKKRLISFTKINKMDKISNLLLKGKTIARFSDRMEFGARALGNRSIIANPSKLDLLKKINTQIKMRDFWMPFTPIILKENAHKYIKNKKNIKCPHMTIAFDTTSLGKKHFAAAIHPYDSTVRPQLLEESVNPKLYKLVKSFEKKTGIGGILNTSFNLHGYPIVCSPKDALLTFINSDLDYLLFNDLYLIKRCTK